jgi:hypothetical protein
MILAVLLLLSGLTISGVAIYYSVMGLMAIFSAAAIPIAIMGVSLEVGKLVTASWVKAHWPRLPLLMKWYAIAAVTILMLITSLGIFGFLSKAHSDQTLISGDVQSKIAIYDEKIKTARENIEADRKQLRQMDEAVDQIMARSDSEKGAEKATTIRRSQQRDRNLLVKDIETNQVIISQLNDQSAPVRAENRKVEAEVGPIKYIAAFVYGSNPDSSILERAVTWVIILIVVVFDPLALVMLLASQMTFAWIREERAQGEDNISVKITKDTQAEIVTNLAGEPPESTPEPPDPYVADVGEKPTEEEKTVDVQTILLPDPVEPKHQYHFEEEHSGEEDPPEIRTWDPEEVQELNQAIEQVDLDIPDIERPGDYVTPPEPPPIRTIEAAPHPGKKDRGASISADNAPHTVGTAVNSDFGNKFPESAIKGDVYLRTDYLPNRLFKFNGVKWIEVDKAQTNTYAYNDKYIWHLIDQLDQGKYDPDILTDVEREQIAEQLEKGRNVQ